MSLPSLDGFKSKRRQPPRRRRSASNPYRQAPRRRPQTGQSCTTPCELQIRPGSDHTITLALNGYHPRTFALSTDGKDGRVTPNPIHAKLQAVAPPAKLKKKMKVVAKKKKPKPATTAAIMSAAEPSAARPAASSEQSPVASPADAAMATTPAPASRALLPVGSRPIEFVGLAGGAELRGPVARPRPEFGSRPARSAWVHA